MPSLSLTPTRCMMLLSLGLAGAAAVVAAPDAGSTDAVAALRARGPAALGELLAHWDRTPPGAVRDELAATIDAVAGQRYATVSRLYWYTDLAAAQEAARALDRPILSLRMLGRLDEELSCANSRLFRTTLYANADVGKLLRERFVLHWSSERPVPRVTIDFGDGRTIERTTTGNSAHYVLDAAGHVLDVLPGLYMPAVFESELRESLALAARVRGLDGRRLSSELAAHHRRAATAMAQRTTAAGELVRQREARATLADAQRVTAGKAAMERPDLRKLGYDVGRLADDDLEAWTALGRSIWTVLDASSLLSPPGRPRMLIGVLDAQSTALVERIHSAGPVKPTPAQLGAMFQRLHQSLVADTALNEVRLRAQIRTRLADGTPRTFEELNDWIYADVFHTPESDAWLGLLPRDVFTGLPGDGALVR